LKFSKAICKIGLNKINHFTRIKTYRKYSKKTAKMEGKKSQHREAVETLMNL